MEVLKTVIPAAGLGTRFLPYTKAIPKEMLPLIKKPAIQHIIEEALSSEINNMLLITGKGKSSIEDHFDYNPWLESFLKEKNKSELIETTERISRCANFAYIRQTEPLGLGHAIWLARHYIGKEHFAIALPDDIIMSKQPALAQLIRIARQEKASVIALQEVPSNQVSSYGVVSIKKQITPNLFQLSGMVEKPSPKNAPSNLAIVGRYILSNKIFTSLEEISSYAQGEMQLTDAINHMTQNGERVFGYKLQGTRFDIGVPAGWVKAVISYSLQDPEYAENIRQFINEIGQTQGFKIETPSKILEI